MAFLNDYLNFLQFITTILDICIIYVNTFDGIWYQRQISLNMCKIYIWEYIRELVPDFQMNVI